MLFKKLNWISDNSNNGIYGTIPSSILNTGSEILSNYENANGDLSSMKRVQENAYKQYIKSRPLAKSIMVRFAKEHIISNTSLGTHPLLGK